MRRNKPTGSGRLDSENRELRSLFFIQVFCFPAMQSEPGTIV